MDDEEARGFPSSQSVGVLGLPTDAAPMMRSLSFEFDGQSGLYLLYVGGDRGKKALHTDRAISARFLAFRAETNFTFRSVLLPGLIERLPKADRERLRAIKDDVWRPAGVTAAATDEANLYRFAIEELVGIKHVGLPEGFEEPPAADGPAESRNRNCYPAG